jgi:ATP-dependent RNA helicase RhlE
MHWTGPGFSRQAHLENEYMTFEQLRLSGNVLRAVSEHGYTIPTPVQAQAIPLILEGRDIMAGAQTGTGKTAGFTLPMLQLLHREGAGHGQRPIRALILAPTRELAAQILESIRTYGKYLPLKSTVVFGGVGIQPQIDKLRHGVDILVATPGRLLDLVGQGKCRLSGVEILVLDEADRMLDMGFIHDIRKVLALLPAKRQNLMFSATFSAEIKQLAAGILHNPALVEVAPNRTAVKVTHVVHPVGKSNKRTLLSHLIASQDWRQVLVFTRTKHGANRLAEQLGKDGIDAAAIHGNKSQTARTKALSGFKSGEVRVLVATDIAARGLDIDQLPHVVNYELPNVAEDYVHRIGRTGRAGHSGDALSLVCREEEKLLAGIERLIGKRIEVLHIPGFTTDFAHQPKTEEVEDGRTPGRHAAGARQGRPAQGHPRSPGAGRRRGERVRGRPSGR